MHSDLLEQYEAIKAHVFLRSFNDMGNANNVISYKNKT